MGRTSVEGATTRSQQRRAEIAASASRLFCDLGYHRVGIDDVAAAVGITGGAIYRHYANKQDLLARTVNDVYDLVDASLAATTGLDDAIAALARVAVDERAHGIRLLREARHLTGDARRAAGRRADGLAAEVAARLRAERPEVSEADGRIVADSLLAVFQSVSRHHVALARGRSTDLLVAMAGAVARADLPPIPASGGGLAPNRVDGALVVARASRREMLLDAAIQLFGRRGYWASRMEDVGAAADIAGPSIYQHFDSKADLLMAALTRGAEGLELGLSRSLAEGGSPEGCLRLLVDSYIDFTLGHQALIGILMDESLYLPPAEQESLRRIQLRYVGEWVNLLEATRPALPEAVARFVTHGAFSLVNDVAQRDLLEVERYRARLVSFSSELLLGTEWTEESS